MPPIANKTKGNNSHHVNPCNKNTHDALATKPINTATTVGWRAMMRQYHAERMELFGKAEKLLLEEGGLVPLYYDNSQIYVQGYVSGLSMPMFGSDFEFSRVKILAH